MVRNATFFCFFLLTGVFGVGAAQERELATHGESIRFTMDSDYKCGDSATINITTEKADSFELDDQAIQTWSDAIRDILGFECSGSIVTLSTSEHSMRFTNLLRPCQASRVHSNIVFSNKKCSDLVKLLMEILTAFRPI